MPLQAEPRGFLAAKFYLGTKEPQTNPWREFPLHDGWHPGHSRPGLEGLYDRHPRQTATAARKEPSGAAFPSHGRPKLPPQGTNSCHQIEPRLPRAFPRVVVSIGLLTKALDSLPGSQSPHARVANVTVRWASDGGARPSRRPGPVWKDSSSSVGAKWPNQPPRSRRATSTLVEESVC